MSYFTKYINIENLNNALSAVGNMVAPLPSDDENEDREEQNQSLSNISTGPPVLDDHVEEHSPTRSFVDVDLDSSISSEISQTSSVDFYDNDNSTFHTPMLLSGAELERRLQQNYQNRGGITPPGEKQTELIAEFERTQQLYESSMRENSNLRTILHDKETVIIELQQALRDCDDKHTKTDVQTDAGDSQKFQSLENECRRLEHALLSSEDSLKELENIVAISKAENAELIFAFEAEEKKSKNATDDIRSLRELTDSLKSENFELQEQLNKIKIKDLQVGGSGGTETQTKLVCESNSAITELCAQVRYICSKRTITPCVRRILKSDLI